MGMAGSFSKKISNLGSRLALIASLMLLAGILAACGDSVATNNDFSVPVINGLEERPVIGSDAGFRSKILLPNKPELVGQETKVFITNRALPDVRQAYKDEMVKRGWVDVSQSILGSTELGAKGGVEAFEKYVGGDTNKKQVFGVIVLSPDATGNLLDGFRGNGTIPPGSNVVINIQGAYGIPAPTK